MFKYKPVGHLSDSNSNTWVSVLRKMLTLNPDPKRKVVNTSFPWMDKWHNVNSSPVGKYFIRNILKLSKHDLLSPASIKL